MYLTFPSAPIVWYYNEGAWAPWWQSYIVYPGHSHHIPIDERIAFLGYN